MGLRLKAERGRGFAHEIVDLDAQHGGERVVACMLDGDDRAFVLAQQFAAAPDLVHALKRCIAALVEAQPYLRGQVDAAYSAHYALQDAQAALAKTEGKLR